MAHAFHPTGEDGDAMASMENERLAGTRRPVNEGIEPLLFNRSPIGVERHPLGVQSVPPVTDKSLSTGGAMAPGI